MKTNHTVCRICRGSGMVTQECICGECDGIGYIKVDPEILRKLTGNTRVKKSLGGKKKWMKRNSKILS